MKPIHFLGLVLLSSLLTTTCIEIPTITSKHIFERFYIIRRLQNAISIFQNHAHPAMQSMSPIDSAYTFKNEYIQSAASALRNDNNFRPLLNVWDHFSSYKWITDNVFTKEFATLIYFVAHHIHTHAHEDTITTKINVHTMTIEALLNKIDSCIANIKQKNITPQQSSEQITDLATQDTNIALRFYLTKRLEKIVHIIQHYSPCQHLSFSWKKNNDGTFQLYGYRFTHPHIIPYLECITQTQNCCASNFLIEDFNNYKNIQDQQFIKEYTTLILILANAMRNQICAPKNIILFDQDEIELETILDAIDLIADELPVLLENYEFNSDMSWKQWLKKYWWAPFIIGATLSVKIWFMFQQAPHK